MKEETPRANRFHIGLFGRRNSGKSSLVNMLTGQEGAGHDDGCDIEEYRTAGYRGFRFG